LLDFLADMERLRRECPWKREQTHRSLARYLQEEAHEVLEAIDAGDTEHLREELGDLLLQVYFHAVIAAEAGEFTLDDVARGIAEKMRRRNPHVFGDHLPSDPAGHSGPSELSAAEVNERWEAIKHSEKPRRSPHDIPNSLPALLLATKVIERLDRRPDDQPKPDQQIGDRLLAVVVDAVAAGVDPEQALRDAVRRLPER
jgi:XTP/dITP diphosphohydrolase